MKGLNDMKKNRIRLAMLCLMLGMVAVLVAAGPAIVESQQVAHAEQIRARCVRAFSAKGPWKAEITETETGSDGQTVTTLQELIVRSPDEYRIVSRERDAEGRQVVSATVRRGSLVSTSRVDADGSTVVHLIRGVRPSLGVGFDTLIGQSVEAVAESRPLRVVGRSKRNGHDADKLELSPGRYVWVDRSTGLPVEEQVVSAGRIVHSVAVNSLEEGGSMSGSAFDLFVPGKGRTVTEEDLGYRRIEDGVDVAEIVGFVPLSTSVPAGFSEGERGYVDPRVLTGDAAGEGACITTFSDGMRTVMVTQIARSGPDEGFAAFAEEGETVETVRVGSTAASFVRDELGSRLVFAHSGVLVTIEGDLTKEAFVALAAGIK